MGRRFATSPSTPRLYYGTAGLKGLNFQWGTAAVVVRPALLSFTQIIWVTNDGAGPRASFILDGSSTFVYDGTNFAFGPTIVIDETYVLATTKASGSVAPRMHTYRFSTNTWVHQNFGASLVDGDPETALTLGAENGASGNFAMDGQMWAAGMWPERVMSDAEVERLARGNWLNMSPAFYEQFSDWMCAPVPSAPSIGRHPARSTVFTATSYGVSPPPPGFRMDARRRRK